MNIAWLDAERPDEGNIAATVALLEAARAVDSPHDLSPTVYGFRTDLKHGWDGDPAEWAVVRDPHGVGVAALEVSLPRWDNTHLGAIAVTVDPRARRQGLGRRLFEIGVDRVREAGRRLVLAGCYDDSPGVEFLKAMGMDRAIEEVKRRLDLSSVDWPRLEEEYAAAQERAAGYELVRIAGAIPEPMLADVVEMTAAINDAPTDDLEVEDEVYTPERIRAFETAQFAHERRLYRIVARQRDTGALAGHTVAAVERDRPWHIWQYDTSVLREHRGHRLGLLLKIAMLAWLRESEPQLRVMDTWNAASNAHMILVNEMLGYQIVASSIEWQRHV